MGRVFRPAQRRARAFSLAELLVVIGVIALLLSILVPALRVGREQAFAGHCGANLQQVGQALNTTYIEFEYYPLWDDGGDDVRYTWIDLLAERRLIAPRSGYCGKDQRPDFLNEARAQAYGIEYPPDRSRFGMDYSYGISVPLSAGVWNSAPTAIAGGAARRFERERDPARRILTSDSHWSAIYNLNGEALLHRIWNLPTQNDNTVAYRHLNQTANFVFQDGHVERARYALEQKDEPVDTVLSYIWFAGETVGVGPSEHGYGNFVMTIPTSTTFPNELRPDYYTANNLWSQIIRK